MLSRDCRSHESYFVSTPDVVCSAHNLMLHLLLTDVTMHMRQLNTNDCLSINARRYSRSQRSVCPRAITDSAITLSCYFTDTISQREPQENHRASVVLNVVDNTPYGRNSSFGQAAARCDWSERSLRRLRKLAAAGDMRAVDVAELATLRQKRLGPLLEANNL